MRLENPSVSTFPQLRPVEHEDVEEICRWFIRAFVPARRPNILEDECPRQILQEL